MIYMYLICAYLYTNMCTHIYACRTFSKIYNYMYIYMYLFLLTFWSFNFLVYIYICIFIYTHKLQTKLQTKIQTRLHTKLQHNSKLDRRNYPPGWIFFTLGWGGGSINSVKRSKSAGSPSASFDRVYTSSSSPQCERNPPQGGNSYDQTILRSKTPNLLEQNSPRNLEQGTRSITTPTTRSITTPNQLQYTPKLNCLLN